MVYANYGRPEDFNWLRSAGVSVIGCVVVMRVGGGVSFAEKVWQAERSGAGGALIYPDPADLPQDPRRLGLNTHTAVSEHVTLTPGTRVQVTRLLTNQHPSVLSNHRSTWVQVTPSLLDSPPSTTLSSRPSSPPACHSSQPCQSAPP